MDKLTIKNEFLLFFEKLYNDHLPSKHTFFIKLKSLSSKNALSYKTLGELYNRYQAVCHATRVMVYYLPYLNRPDLRVRKLSIISDDDSPYNGQTHHDQLKQVFVNLGAVSMMDNNVFGELDEIRNNIDINTALILDSIQKLYPKTLGAWCIVENFSENWMHALMDGLSICFPSVVHEPYFSDCFSQGIEKKHGLEALNLTLLVLNEHPTLLKATMETAYCMAVALDNFWTSLEQDLLIGGV